MRYLEKDSDIIPGDIVLASGINQELPLRSLNRQH